MKTAVKYGGLLVIGFLIGGILGYTAGMPSLEERKAIGEAAKLIEEKSTLQRLLQEKERQLEEVQEEFQRIKSELETANSTISSLKQQIQTLKAQFATPAVQVKATIEKRGFLEDDLRIEVRNITNRTLENVKILVISLDKNGEVMFSPFGFKNEERIPLIYPGERAIVSVTPTIRGVSYKILAVTSGGIVHVATAK